MLDELTVTPRGSGRNGACGFPLAYAGAHEFAHGDLAWPNVSTRSDLGENLGCLSLRLSFGAA